MEDGRLISDHLRSPVYRKPTNTNLYINWFSYSPTNWKVGTFTNLVRRAVNICSDEGILKTELL